MTRQLDRRRFLKTALAAGAVATVPASGWASSHIGGTITVTSYGGAWEQFMRSTIVPGFEKAPRCEGRPRHRAREGLGGQAESGRQGQRPLRSRHHQRGVGGAAAQPRATTPSCPRQGVDLKDVAPNLKIKDDMGVLSLVGPIGLAYRSDKIKTAPKAWKDLWTVPEYKGKIGIYNIVNSAGQMFIALTSKIWTGGDKDIDTAYKKIAELKPFKQTDFSGDMEKLLVQGEVQIGILDMPAAIRLKRDGAPVAWAAPMRASHVRAGHVGHGGSKNKPTALPSLVN